MVGRSDGRLEGGDWTGFGLDVDGRTSVVATAAVGFSPGQCSPNLRRHSPEVSIPGCQWHRGCDGVTVVYRSANPHLQGLRLTTRTVVVEVLLR